MTPTGTTTTNNLSNNINKIHLSNSMYNDTKYVQSNPSLNDKNQNQNHCDGDGDGDGDNDDYETNSITYNMEKKFNNDDSTCDLEKPTPWYGSTFVHWLVFDVIG